MDERGTPQLSSILQLISALYLSGRVKLQKKNQTLQQKHLQTSAINHVSYVDHHSSSVSSGGFMLTRLQNGLDTSPDQVDGLMTWQ